MTSPEVNFHFILYSREHSMRDSEMYKAYCGTRKNHMQIFPLESSKGHEKKNERK